MISGKLKKDLSIDEILLRTSPYEIFKFYIPGNWEVNDIMCSPLRKDDNPSFLVGNKYGELNFKDFAVSDHKGDVFNFVKLKFGLPNLDAVLRLIDQDLNLGIGSGSEIRTSPITQINEPEVSKTSTLIQVVTRKFTNNELDYWNSYYQDLKDLQNNNIFSIKKLYLNKKLVSIKDDELRFGYFYPSTSTWKIYFPHRDKRRKWMGNVSLSETYGKERLKSDKNTLICKSLKDFLVCTKIYENCIQVQNESLAAFSEETVEYIKNNSKAIFYGGDSDFQGKRASYQITAKLGYKHINPPDYLLNDCCKDFSDWAKHESLEKVKEHFKIKGLYE